MERKTGKRIVSNGRYAVTKTYACFLSGATVLCGTATFLLLLSLPYSWYLSANDPDPWLPPLFLACIACLFCLPVLLPLGVWLLRGSRDSWEDVHTMQPIMLANTADLPAPESLVRASEEPTQAQQVVLLRAAAQGMKTPPEQLVRAFVGQENHE